MTATVSMWGDPPSSAIPTRRGNTPAPMPTRAYVLLQSLSALSCQNKFWDHAPTQEDATDQLRAKAARLGGNGLVNVGCEPSGVGMTSVSKNCWTWLTCHGTAIQVRR